MRWSVVLLVSSLIFTSARAHAQEDASNAAAARSLAKDAKDAFDSGDWEKARDLYHRANDVVAAPTLALREAHALIKLGRLIEASELLLKTSRWPLGGAPKAFRSAAHQAGSEFKKLQPRLPKLKLMVESNQPAQMRLDGHAVPPALMNVERPVDPGVHLIEGTVAGKPILPQRVRLAEGEHLEIVLQVPGAPAVAPTSPPSAAPSTESPAPSHVPPPASAPAPSPPTEPSPVSTSADRDGDSHRGSTQRTIGLLVGGVGVAGLGVGVLTGLIALGKHADLDVACPGNQCPSSSRSNLDSFRTMRTISDVGYIVGAVGIGAGALLFLTAPSPAQSSTAIVPWIGPGSGGLRGTF